MDMIMSEGAPSIRRRESLSSLFSERPALTQLTGRLAAMTVEY
jgi:hypothetical protein